MKSTTGPQCNNCYAVHISSPTHACMQCIRAPPAVVCRPRNKQQAWNGTSMEWYIKEQAWNGNTIDLLTDHRSLHQWLLWLTIASSASCC